MWIVNYDHLEKKPVAVMSGDFDKGAVLNQPFRLLDDDGVVYYEGLSDDSDSEAAFAPLDDYGMPNAGCTSIQYKRGTKWETL